MLFPLLQSLAIMEEGAPTIDVSIRSVDGKTISINIPSNATVGELKKKIEDDKSLNVTQPRLIFQGNELLNEQTLADAKIENGFTIHLAPPDPQSKEAKPTFPGLHEVTPPR